MESHKIKDLFKRLCINRQGKIIVDTKNSLIAEIKIDNEDLCYIWSVNFPSEIFKISKEYFDRFY